MTENEMNIAQVREEAAFDDGAIAAFKALREIYNMDTETRNILFGDKGLPNIIQTVSPQHIFSILNNREELINSYVQVGDVIARGEGEAEIRILVTFTNDHEHFDGIILNGSYRGSVWKNTTISESHSHKTGDHENNFTILTKYSWE